MEKSFRMPPVMPRYLLSQHEMLSLRNRTSRVYEGKSVVVRDGNSIAMSVCDTKLRAEEGELKNLLSRRGVLNSGRGIGLIRMLISILRAFDLL
jgi:hypothetical protein